MLAHPEYVNNRFNNELLAAYINAKKMSWRFERLESAYEALTTAEEFDNSISPAKPEVQRKVEVKSEFEWPRPLTKKIIDEIPREDYRRFVKNPQFIEQVNAVLKGEK